MIALDERGAAFYALGYARAHNRAAVLICTSGTAVANYYPAVIEAYQSRLPLIILSADRPPELRDSGANQTIDQSGIYGKYTNWAVDLPTPDAGISPRFILSTVGQAVHRAVQNPAGPVQINCMFREPLEPTPAPYPENYTKDIEHWKVSDKPWTGYAPFRYETGQNWLQDLAAKISARPKTVLAAGRLPDREAARALEDLTRHTGWPLFADILSGITTGDDQIQGVGWYDHLLASDTIKGQLRDYRIIHIGDPMTSKRFLQFVTVHAPDECIHVQDHPRRQDPSHIIRTRITADIPAFCRQLTSLLPSFEPDRSLAEPDRLAGELVRGVITNNSAVSEIGVAMDTARLVPADQGLFLGSSMPVRDFDMFGRIAGRNVPVAANRGASGIDGSISSAVGFARGLSVPVTAVIGDLAFIHDLNALDLLRRSPQKVILIVINNNGGGIFSFLPIAGFKAHFEDFFATPHGLTFSKAAELFGIKHMGVSAGTSFPEVYRQALGQRESVIIEVFTDREKNVRLHRSILDLVVDKLDDRKKS
jgi:2-succinyl-5-enolpyruvyl-6-hydroxy-3-cyclohexene-1-carboxylate synthase